MSSLPEFEVELEIEPEFLWRREQLERAGFTEFGAFRIAANDVDYRKAISYLENGMTEEQVLDQLLDD